MYRYIMCVMDNVFIQLSISDFVNFIIYIFYLKTPSLCQAQTPLEQQIFSLLHSNHQPVTDPVLTPVEEASIRAMSLEEVSVGHVLHKPRLQSLGC